ncbi:MAG: hypothetical protein O7B79_03595 [SAR324 cluster bacterium]|nr:hypothetical protein [SAR324 cluster bacterium]
MLLPAMLVLAATVPHGQARHGDGSALPRPLLPVSAEPAAATGPASPAGEDGSAASGGIIDERLEASARKVAAKAAHAARESLRGQSITLGPTFSVVDIKFFRDEKFADGPSPSAKMTDNGRLTLFLRYQTEETYFIEAPMQVGFFRFGYNFISYFMTFKTEKQETLDEIFGEDLGTGASGEVLGFAPFLFVVLGPLYPGTEIYWKTGAGIGVAVLRYEADVLYRNNQSPNSSRERLSDKDYAPNFFQQALWELDIGNWVLTFQISQITGSTQTGGFFYNERSLSLGYGITF